MGRSISESDKAYLQMFPDTGKCSLPMPRFGKTPASAQHPQSLPNSIAEANAFTLSWVDEEELGVRVFVTAAPTGSGTEIRVSVEGVRPDLLGMAAYVSLDAADGRSHRSLTILLDEPTANGCTGRGSFGTVDELRKRLGNMVTLDLFLIESTENRKPTEEQSGRLLQNGTGHDHHNQNENGISDADWDFLNAFPDTGKCTLPIPRFGKTPPSEQFLPTSVSEMNSFSLSWVDEENLGIGVFVTAAKGSEGIELRVRVEGTRSDLVGQAAHISLTSAHGREDTSLIIPLENRSDDGQDYSGQDSFGTLEELRNRLGDKVELDVFLIDYPPIPKSNR